LEPLDLGEDDLISLVHENRRQLPLWPGDESWEDDKFEDVIDINDEES
jgi:hypothetical protein